MSLIHPNDALFAGEKKFPVIPSCEHFAGSEKLIGKAARTRCPSSTSRWTAMPVRPPGRRRSTPRWSCACSSDLNQKKMSGVRINGPTHAAWKQDVDIVVPKAGDALAYLTIPKPTAVGHVAEMVGYIQKVAKGAASSARSPSTCSSRRTARCATPGRSRRCPGCSSSDFGLMDFISGHHGAIPASCMKSPGQIEHALLRRAKSEMVAAALANGCVPAHNVTLDLKDTYKTYQDEKRAREEFGYLRMWSIYPAQIQPIVDAMAPNFGEVQRASEILLAAQKGVVSRTPSACPPLGFDKLVRPADRRLIRRPELDRKKASHDQVSS